MMLDHLELPSSDLRRSRDFFVRALAPLGVTVLKEFPEAIGMGRDGEAELWLGLREAPVTSIHVAFTAMDRAQVDAFYREAIAAGGIDHGAPGLRPHYHANYYAAFVIGPDGHNVEAVCHRPVE